LNGRPVQRAALVNQGGQRRLHAGLALAGRQPQDEQVLPGRPRRLSFHEQVVGQAEAAGGEQVGLVLVLGEGAGLADQPADNVPVVDPVPVPAAQPRQPLHQALAVEHLDGLGADTSLDPLADQPRRHRVGVAFDPDGAARCHLDLLALERLQPARRQGPQQGTLLGQTVRPVGVALLAQLPQELLVGRPAVEVAAAAQQQGLLQGPLEAVVALLAVAILVGLAGLDGLAGHAVVGQQGPVALGEQLGVGRLVDRQAHAVGAVLRRHAA
jgi:hypothetical protein